MSVSSVKPVLPQSASAIAPVVPFKSASIWPGLLLTAAVAGVFWVLADWMPKIGLSSHLREMVISAINHH